VEIVYNASEYVQYSAVMSIVVISLVILLLVGFTMMINAKINQMVLRPLDRIFTSIKDAMSDVMSAINATSTSTSTATATAKQDPNATLRRTQSATHTTSGQVRSKGGATELDVLEAALHKLSSIGDHVTLSARGASKDMMAVMEDHSLDDESKEWLRDTYTTGHVHARLAKAAKENRRRGGISRDPSQRLGHSTNESKIESMKLARRQTRETMRQSLTKVGVGHVTKDLIETFDYDVLLYTTVELHYHVQWIFTETNCTADFKVSNATSYAFIKEVCAMYSDANPYHNFYHAADAIQTLYMFMRANSGETLLSCLDIFAALVGALGHDIGHPGVNAAYLVNARHELAMAYNDTSVLENMHAATLYTLLHDHPEANPFANLNDADWRHARKTIVSAVLATDMAHHFDMVHEAEIFFEVNESKLEHSTERVSLFKDNPKNADFLLRLWMHASDISNPVKNFTVCQKWCTAVTEEFFAQGDREQVEGMAVSAMMDRATTNTSQLQVNFIEFVVGPLYLVIIKIFPEIFELGIQLCYNRKQWGKRWMEDLRLEAAHQQVVHNPMVSGGGAGDGKQVVSTGEKLAAESRKNETRRQAFEDKFAFMNQRQQFMGLSSLARHLRVPGAKPFNFTGSAGPGVNVRKGSRDYRMTIRSSSAATEPGCIQQIGRDISPSVADDKPIRRTLLREGSRGQLRRQSDEQARDRRAREESLDTVGEEPLEVWLAPEEQPGQSEQLHNEVAQI
jgi:hypothetical protein